MPAPGGLLHQLYRRQLFTNRLAGTPPTYQYHDLFRQFLLARAEEMYPRRELKQFANRAAALLEENDQLEEAVGLYLRTEDWDAASRSDSEAGRTPAFPGPRADAARLDLRSAARSRSRSRPGSVTGSGCL